MWGSVPLIPTLFEGQLCMELDGTNRRYLLITRLMMKNWLM